MLSETSSLHGGGTNHDMSQIAIIENSLLLIKGNTEAIKEIFGVSLREISRIREASGISCSVGMVLNGFNDVSKTFFSESFLGKDSMHIITLNINIVQGTLVNISRLNWVLVDTMIVRNWPGRSGHNSLWCTSLRVDRAEHSASRESSSSLNLSP